MTTFSTFPVATSQHGSVDTLAPSRLGIPLAGRLAKRGFDIVAAAALLLLILPAVLFVAILIKIDSRGPVLFSQTRVGENGRRFRIYKFRTMRPDGDDAVHATYVAALIRGDAAMQDGMYKLTSDPRVTRLGRALRRSSIDELPQLLNVLRGEMSLVGPRPALPREVELYDRGARRRLAGKPGITGLWQVSGRTTLSFQEMVDLDVHYLSSWSPMLELKILLRTPAALIFGRGAA